MYPLIRVKAFSFSKATASMSICSKSLFQHTSAFSVPILPSWNLNSSTFRDAFMSGLLNADLMYACPDAKPPNLTE